MTMPPHPAPLPVLPHSARLGVAARSAPGRARSQPDDAEIAEALVPAAGGVLRALRFGTALALVFWGALAALIAWFV